MGGWPLASLPRLRPLLCFPLEGPAVAERPPAYSALLPVLSCAGWCALSFWGCNCGGSFSSSIHASCSGQHMSSGPSKQGATMVCSAVFISMQAQVSGSCLQHVTHIILLCCFSTTHRIMCADAFMSSQQPKAWLLPNYSNALTCKASGCMQGSSLGVSTLQRSCRSTLKSRLRLPAFCFRSHSAVALTKYSLCSCLHPGSHRSGSCSVPIKSVTLCKQIDGLTELSQANRMRTAEHIHPAQDHVQCLQSGT